MSNQRLRPVLFAAAALVIIWIAAVAGYTIARNAKITPEKVRAYVSSVDFAHLSAADRAHAMEKLAAMLNALSLEERQKLQLDRTAYAWFKLMTEEEKGKFLEAIMPTGFKQMIGAFEEMPEDKRKRALDGALKRLREQREQAGAGAPGGNGNDAALSPELEAKVRSIGLKSFYGESSAQTKAELAPLLEELQHSMESGRVLRGR